MFGETINQEGGVFFLSLPSLMFLLIESLLPPMEIKPGCNSALK